MHRLALICTIAAGFAFGWSPLTNAQEYLKWQPENGFAIREGNFHEWTGCTAIQSDQESPGTIGLVWNDTRIGFGQLIFQSIDPNGDIRQADNGRPVFNSPVPNNYPQIIPAPDGCWFLAWEDFRRGANPDIYYTKLSPDGDPLWGAETKGLLLAGGEGRELRPQLVKDSNDGFFVVWVDEDLAPNGVVRTQHILEDGAIDERWPVDGLLTESPEGAQYAPAVIADGEGGLFIVWISNVGGGNDRIRAQRISDGGDLLWGNQGILVNGVQSDKFEPKICSDGEGGIFLAWYDDNRGGASMDDVLGQRITGMGEILWAENGEVLAGGENGEWGQSLVPAEQGSMILIFERWYQGVDNDLLCMKFSGDNAPVREWEPDDGVSVAEADLIQTLASTVSDGHGGFFAIWKDNRREGSYNYDLYAQHVDLDGEVLWEPAGISVAAEPFNEQNTSILLHPDGDAVFVWELGTEAKIKTQRFATDDGTPHYEDEPLCLAHGMPGYAENAKLTRMGDNRFAVTWLDNRLCDCVGMLPYVQFCRDAGDHPDTLAQSNGIPLQVEHTGFATSFESIWDGNDGVITAWRGDVWEDGNRIFAQRVNENERLWGENGIYVADKEYGGHQIDPMIVSDDASGALVFWTCPGEFGHNEIFFQHLDGAGRRLLGEFGQQLTQDPVEMSLLDEVVSDGEGGAIVFWSVWREPYLLPFANRVTADGQKLWGDGAGIQIGPRCIQRFPLTAMKHPEGYIAVWEKVADNDFEQSNIDIIGQFIDIDGNLNWGANGKVICGAPLSQYRPRIELNTDNSIWIVWQDSRGGQDSRNHRLYIQRVLPGLDDHGALQCLLPPNGLRLFEAESYLQDFELRSDGHAGLWVIWRQQQEGAWDDVYGTHLQPNLRPYAPWEAAGHSICSVTNQQRLPDLALLRDDAESGVAVVWEDGRGTVNYSVKNIYLQRVDDDAAFVSVPSEREYATTPTTLAIESISPNPFNSSVTIQYSVASRFIGHTRLAIYDLSVRLVADLTAADPPRSAGEHKVTWDASAQPAGIYLLRLEINNAKLSRKLVLMK